MIFTLTLIMISSLLTYDVHEFLFASLLIIQSLNPKVNVAFILFVLHFILLIGNIESNPGPEPAYISSTPLSALDILSDKFIFICIINIRSIRNKINFLQNFVNEFDIIALIETHLDNSIENRDIELDSFDKNPQRKDRTNSGGHYLFTQRKTSAFAGNTNLKMI